MWGGILSMGGVFLLMSAVLQHPCGERQSDTVMTSCLEEISRSWPAIFNLLKEDPSEPMLRDLMQSVTGSVVDVKGKSLDEICTLLKAALSKQSDATESKTSIAEMASTTANPFYSLPRAGSYRSATQQQQQPFQTLFGGVQSQPSGVEEEGYESTEEYEEEAIGSSDGEEVEGVLEEEEQEQGQEEEVPSPFPFSAPSRTRTGLGASTAAATAATFPSLAWKTTAPPPTSVRTQPTLTKPKSATPKSVPVTKPRAQPTPGGLDFGALCVGGVAYLTRPSVLNLFEEAERKGVRNLDSVPLYQLCAMLLSTTTSQPAQEEVVVEEEEYVVEPETALEEEVVSEGGVFQTGSRPVTVKKQQLQPVSASAATAIPPGSLGPDFIRQLMSKSTSQGTPSIPATKSTQTSAFGTKPGAANRKPPRTNLQSKPQRKPSATVKRFS